METNEAVRPEVEPKDQIVVLAERLGEQIDERMRVIGIREARVAEQESSLAERTREVYAREQAVTNISERERLVTAREEQVANIQKIAAQRKMRIAVLEENAEENKKLLDAARVESAKFRGEKMKLEDALKTCILEKRKLEAAINALQSDAVQAAEPVEA